MGDAVGERGSFIVDSFDGAGPGVIPGVPSPAPMPWRGKLPAVPMLKSYIASFMELLLAVVAGGTMTKGKKSEKLCVELRLLL